LAKVSLKRLGEQMMGAMCYAICPPTKIEDDLMSMLKKNGKVLTGKDISLIQEVPVPDEYHKIVDRLRDVGFQIRWGTYNENLEQKVFMIVSFYDGDEMEIMLDPAPGLLALEAMARFLEGDPSVSIQELDEFFRNVK
jgi:hypothetical protein